MTREERQMLEAKFNETYHYILQEEYDVALELYLAGAEASREIIYESKRDTIIPSRHQAEDYLEDVGMIEDGKCPFLVTEIFQEGVDYGIKKMLGVKDK